MEEPVRERVVEEFPGERGWTVDFGRKILNGLRGGEKRVGVYQAVRSADKLTEMVISGALSGEGERSWAAAKVLLEFMEFGVESVGEVKTEKDEAILEVYKRCLVSRARKILEASVDGGELDESAFRLGVEIVLGMRDLEGRERWLLDIKDELIDKERFKELSELVSGVTLNLAQIGSEDSVAGAEELIDNYFDSKKVCRNDGNRYYRHASTVAELYARLYSSDDVSVSEMGEKKILDMLESIGIEDSGEMLGAWMRVGRRDKLASPSQFNEKESVDGQILNVFENIRRVIDIEEIHPGTCAHCRREYGIRNFSRVGGRVQIFTDIAQEDALARADFSGLDEDRVYSFGELEKSGVVRISRDFLSRLREVMGKVGVEVGENGLRKAELQRIAEVYKGRRMGVWVEAVDDWNNAFSGLGFSHAKWDLHNELVENPEYGMRLIEVKGGSELLARQNRLARRHGKIVFGLLSAHGSESGFDLGDEEVTKDKLTRDMGGVRNKLYERGAEFVFASCSTGKGLFPIARTIAKRLGITCYAPVGKADLRGAELVVPDNGGKPMFKDVEYVLVEKEEGDAFKTKKVRTRRFVG